MLILLKGKVKITNRLIQVPLAMWHKKYVQSLWINGVSLLTGPL